MSHAVNVLQDSRDIIVKLHELHVNLSNPGNFDIDSYVIMNIMMKLVVQFSKLLKNITMYLVTLVLIKLY